MRHGDLLAGFVLLGFSLIALFVVIPAQIATGEAAGLSPRGMPTFTASMIGLLSLVLVIRSGIAALRGGGDGAVHITRAGFYRASAGFLIILAGVVLFAALGFIASGLFTIAALMLLMGERRPAPLLLIPLLTTAALYVFVVYGLHVQVP